MFPEHDLAALFDAIDAPVVLFDGGGAVRCMNARAQLLLGDIAVVPWNAGAGAAPVTTAAGEDSVEWAFRSAGDAIVATGRIVTGEALLRADIAALRRSEAQERAVADFGFSALTEHDLGAVMREACHLVRAVMHCDAAVILGHDAESGTFRAAAAAGLDVPADAISIEDEPASLTRHVFDTDQAVRVDDIDRDPRFRSRAMADLGYRSIISVAISGPYAPYGTLDVLSRTPSAFAERDAVFIRSLTNLVGAAMARRAAEDESSRARRDYQRLIELAQEGVLLLDLYGQITLANPKAGEILGRPPEHLVGASFYDVVAPEDAAVVLRQGTQRLKGLSSTYDVRLLREDGTRVPVSVAAAPVPDASGAMTSVLLMLSDITERVHAERAHIEREARLRLILGNLPVVIWTTDRDLNITSLGGAGMQMSTGVETTLAELLGDRDYMAELRLPLAGRAVAFESRMVGRDVRVRVEPFRDSDGAVIGTVGVAYDVTEQVAAERAREDLLGVVARSATEWRATFDSIGSAVLLLDGEHRVVRLNAAALALSGHPAYLDVVGRPVRTVSEQPLWTEILGAAIASRSREMPITFRARTGERRWDVVVASAAAHTTVVASDVTAIARMEESLQRSERMSSVGALVAGVAHEVRNPLFGISATLDAFEARYGDGQFRPYTSALREQLQRMNELMYDLLELGRPASSVLAPGALAPVLTSAAASERMLAARAKVTVQTALPPALPDLPMDRPRLLQVFENLIRNAVQHAPAGSVVEVSAHVEADGVVILVEDRGPGFRDEDLPRVFEPFFTRRRGGTGLGLSLVQRIVDDHHGHIEARNREGGGASVRVSLPTGVSAS